MTLTHLILLNIVVGVVISVLPMDTRLRSAVVVLVLLVDIILGFHFIEGHV